MGMDFYLVAVRDMGGKFEKMLKINQFCGDHGVSAPKEVAEYFGELVGEDEQYIRSEMAEFILASGRGTWDAKQSDIPLEIGMALLIES